MIYDVNFYTHASNLTGFGHASRCLKVAKRIRELMPELKICFSGEFDEHALSLMQNYFALVLCKNAASKVVVYDRMDDHEIPENYDVDLLNSVARNSDKVVFMANGLRPPKLPPGVVCIGYKLGGYEAYGPDVFWSLKFAPTEPNSKGTNKSNFGTTGSALVALGGDRSNHKLKSVLRSLVNIKEIESINVLLSPVNPCDSPVSILPSRCKKKINFFSNVEDVHSMFSASQIVVTSYGHLGYEAIASGSSVCLFGQKVFQSEFAKNLQEAGLCVAGGLLGQISEDTIVAAILKTLEKSEMLKQAPSTLIDENGIDRIAHVIIKQLS